MSGIEWQHRLQALLAGMGSPVPEPVAAFDGASFMDAGDPIYDLSSS